MVNKGKIKKIVVQLRGSRIAAFVLAIAMILLSVSFCSAVNAGESADPANDGGSDSAVVMNKDISGGDPEKNVQGDDAAGQEVSAFYENVNQMLSAMSFGLVLAIFVGVRDIIAQNAPGERLQERRKR